MTKNLIQDKESDITKPEPKLSSKEEGTNDLFDGIDLSEEKAQELLVETVGETFLDGVAEFIHISKFLNFSKSYNQKIDRARTIMLLSEFKEKHENTDKFKGAFKKIISTPSGMNLLQKIIRITQVNIADKSYIDKLATVLKNISDSDFETLFQEHNYVLSQIEKLTPQALLLLSDQINWPPITFASTTSSGVTTGRDWDTAFAILYSNRKGKYDEKTRARIVHSINELKNNNLVGLEATHIPLTLVGEEVYRYLE